MAVLAACTPATIDSPTIMIDMISPANTTGGHAVTIVSDCNADAKPGCVLRGGQDSLVVHATFAEIDIPSSKAITAPTVTILADGAPITAPTMTELAVNPRSFVSTPFQAPARAVQRLTVRVVASPGYEYTASGFSVEAPVATLDTTCNVDGEPDGSTQCTRTLGEATFSYRAWVPDGTKATLTSLLDGVPHGDPVEETMVAHTDGPAEAVFSLTVPDSGKNWTLHVDTAGVPRAEKTIVLSAPEKLSLALLDCTSAPDAGDAAEVQTCERGAGLSLQVTAPRGLHATEATVRALVDSVYLPDVISVPLDIVDGAHQLGVAQVVLPTTGRRVEYHASVGLNTAPAVSINLVAPAKTP
ncbi:MAG TPA: hypothetical protein VH062_34085 [Polyangiaceae bacterium]|nr:hypothetical protein [Polyangiaceae bacterium]